MRSTKLSLYKRSNGVWYVGYFENGRRRWLSTGKKLKSEALNELTNFEHRFREKSSRMVFSEFVEQFCLLQATSLRKSTIERIYRPAFRSFQAHCGDRILDSYSVRDIEKFKGKRLANCRPTTVNIEFRTLRAAFNCAVRWKFLVENPFKDSSNVKVPERPPIHFTESEFRLFLGEVTEPYLKDVFLFAALTGLRQGEILSLRWENIELDRRLIFVVNSDRFLTKSGKCRIVPMSYDVHRLLSAKIAARTSLEYVFQRNDGPLTQSFVDHKFKKYVRRAGLRDELKFHSLRHTFATWLAKSGVNIYEIQKLLGHSDVKTTQIYSHLAASELHAAVNKIVLQLN